MDNEKLCTELIKELAQYLKLDEDVIQQHRDTSFFHKPFYMSSEKLLYFFLIQAKKYPILFKNQNAIYEGGMSTINNILNMLYT